MDAFFLCQQYDYLQRLTEQMLAESEAPNWQRVHELDEQRALVLANMSGADLTRTLSTLDLTSAEKIRQCIQTILKANLLLSERAEVEKSKTQTALHSSSVSSRLNRAYSSPF